MPVLRVSFVKVLELLQPLWLTLELGEDLLSERQKNELVKRFYDQVTILALRMASGKDPEKKQRLDTIRAAIAQAAGISPGDLENKEEN